MNLLLKNCEYVLTQDRERRVLRNKDIGIEEGKITEVTDETEKSYEEVLDCKGKAVMPGLINTHTHAGMSLLRGYSDDKELFKWLEEIWKVEDKMGEKEVTLGTQLSMLEMIKTGTTTFSDMYFAMKKLPRVVEEAGMRAHLGWAVFDPEKSTQKGEPIKNAENFVRENKGKELVKPVVAPHAIYTCDDELMKKSKELADREKVLLHTHAAETRKELLDCINTHGERVIEHLDSLEVLDENILLAHVGWITKREAQILGKRSSIVSHCPISNMKLATGGICPVPELMEAGASVTLGTDGPVSNNSLNMFETMKITALIHKHARWKASLLPAQQVLDMTTLISSKALKQKTGAVKEGMKADMITLDLKNPQNTPLHNLQSNIVYSIPSTTPVVDSVINGQLIMKDGDILTMPEEKIMKEASETAEELTSR